MYLGIVTTIIIIIVLLLKLWDQFVGDQSTFDYGISCTLFLFFVWPRKSQRKLSPSFLNCASFIAWTLLRSIPGLVTLNMQFLNFLFPLHGPCYTVFPVNIHVGFIVLESFLLSGHFTKVFSTWWVLYCLYNIIFNICTSMSFTSYRPNVLSGPNIWSPDYYTDSCLVRI